MFLYLARHAWAGHFGDPGWPDDSLRELTPEGEQRYARMIDALAERGFSPRRIATSPYARCRQTAEIMAQGVGAEIEEIDALAPGANLETLLEWTANQQEEEVCWVGHNPDMPALASKLLGADAANLRFAKGSVCAVRFDDPPSATGELPFCELVWHVTAKVLGV